MATLHNRLAALVGTIALSFAADAGVSLPDAEAADAREESAPEPGVIRFDIQVQAKRKGAVHCALYDNRGDWLSRKVLASTKVAVDGEWVTCVFANVKQRGQYAIAALHDEDGDADMDTFLGLPLEGYTTSRDAQKKSLYPKWKNAVFSFSGGEVNQIGHMKY